MPKSMRQPVAEGASRNGEMRIDDVKAAPASELHPAPEAHWQIRRHRRQVRDRELAAEEDRHTLDLHSGIGALRGRSPAREVITVTS